MTDIQEPEAPKTMSADQATEVANKFRDLFEKAYATFLQTALRIPCHDEQRKLAIQFLDTGALWLQHGIVRAIEDSLNRQPPEPTPPAKEAAPTKEASEELQQPDAA